MESFMGTALLCAATLVFSTVWGMLNAIRTDGYSPQPRSLLAGKIGLAAIVVVLIVLTAHSAYLHWFQGLTFTLFGATLLGLSVALQNGWVFDVVRKGWRRLRG
jgi:hypothetical protein